MGSLKETETMKLARAIGFEEVIAMAKTNHLVLGRRVRTVKAAGFATVRERAKVMPKVRAKWAPCLRCWAEPATDGYLC